MCTNRLGRQAGGRFSVCAKKMYPMLETPQQIGGEPGLEIEIVGLPFIR
ncbi:hypothetical protein [Xenorhabdus bovienii]|nr:hypothetical protein [Xenorhabdus bovienii]